MSDDRGPVMPSTSAHPDLPAARPLWLDLVPDPVFGVFHGAASPASGSAAPSGRTGVLIVPPFGWLDVASYRSRRTWAETLAAAGHPTLRIDLPGTGDSGGTAADPDRTRAWLDAVAAAARWLRAQGGVDRVAAIGLGLGGLVAVRALADGAAIDDVVAWGFPAQGRSLIRQDRAFAGMQGARWSLTGEPEPRRLPEGWLEVNGFVLAAETIAAIEGIDLRTTATGMLARALLLETDGLPVDAAWRAHLEAAGVAVTTAPGPGWAALTFHPERYEPPTEVMATVAAWLEAAGDRHPRPAVEVAAPSAPAAHEAATLRIGDDLVRESALWVTTAAGSLFGLLAEPASTPDGAPTSGDAAPSPLVAVFLNAGAVRRIGPNRTWVETARRWAARGVPVLRIDLEGIGDSDGDAARYRDVGEFYRDEIGDQIQAFTDALLARGIGPRVVLAGLCAGGFWAFQGAGRDDRVTAALMVNPGALVWHHDLVRRRDARKLQRLLQPAWWGRLLRGKVRLARIRTIARAAATSATSTAAAADRDPSAVFDRLHARQAAVLLAFSNDEALEAELASDGVLAAMDRWPNVRRERLPGRDHTVRPVAAQEAVARLLDAELDRELARAAVRLAEPPVAVVVGGER